MGKPEEDALALEVENERLRRKIEAAEEALRLRAQHAREQVAQLQKELDEAERERTRLEARRQKRDQYPAARILATTSRKNTK